MVQDVAWQVQAVQDVAWQAQDVQDSVWQTWQVQNQMTLRPFAETWLGQMTRKPLARKRL